MKIQIILFVLVLYSSARLYTISTTPCNSTSYFNSITMQCQNCTEGMIGNYTNCYCPPGTQSSAYNSADGSTNLSIDPVCSNLSTINNCPSNYGDRTQPCPTSCQSNTLFNSSTKSCQWCGVNSDQSLTGQCGPINATYIKGVGGYYDVASFINRTSNYIAYLPHNYVGCMTHNNTQSCSFLINICLYSLFSETVCNHLNSSQGNPFTSQSSYSALASLSSSGGVSTLSMVLMKFLPTGQYHSSKLFSLNDVLYCESKTDYIFKIGNTYQQSCLFNFNNVLQMMISNVQKQFTYSLFLADQAGNYHLIPVQTNANRKTVLVSRFFMADIFSVPLTRQLTVMNSFTLQLTLNSDKHLVSPKLIIYYIHLNVNAAGVLTSPIQTVSYKINYNYNVQGFYNVALPLFIVFTVIAMLQAALRTYIAYLNKRSPFIYIVYFAQNWTSWMFVLLLGLTGYWFFFTKATTDIYVLMPLEGKLYTPFIGVVVAMVLIRALVVTWIKYDSFKTDIFFIDWEISPLKNCWRQIFIANSLSEFFTFRTISFGWILVWTTFFLVGLGWQNQGKISTSLRSWTIFSSQNSILLFFIGCSVLFLIGIIFKIFRKLVMTWWPHPFDDFVDLCCLANISVYFPRRNTSTGYYIHGNNASGSQITLFELNNAILKGQLRKTNSLWNPVTSVSEANTFILYANNELHNKLFNLRKEDEQTSYDMGKKKGYIQLFKNRQSFINNDLKKTFLNLPKERNPLQKRTAFQQYLGIPPVNKSDRKDTLTLVADTSFSICDIFPNSDEFADIITYCILFGALNVALKSSAIAAFLSYLILQWVVQAILGKAARIHIQYCTKVKQGFML